VTTAWRAVRQRARAVLLACLPGVLVCPGAAPLPALAASARPDAALYRQAQAAETSLRASKRRQARRSDWEQVTLLYRKVVARYPRSGYCDNALLGVGNLYRDMAGRFHSSRYREDALGAYRTLVAEYPSSSLGDDALWAVVEISRDSGDRRRLAEAGQAYLDTFPEGRRASRVKRLMRERTPATPIPSPPPPGLARVYDLRSWSGDSSTRVVLYLERKVELQSDRVSNPDRLWIDLARTRLHPNLARRVFPVGDGLLEQVRIAQNREDVVRVVLDFKEVWEHNIFYLEDPTRLVIDVRGQPQPAPAIADAERRGIPASAEKAPPPPSGTASGARSGPGPSRPDTQDAAPLPSRRLNGMVAPDARPSTAAGPIAIAGVDALPGRRRVPSEARSAPAPTAPEPPATNRAGSYSLARQLGLGARRIVIDAGHGGHDPGTIGRGGLQEKDLVLDVALRVERLVRQELGTEVVMTRSTDVFVPLEERTAIANTQRADLFLSIHANSSRNPRARGIETYFLNFARSPHAEEVAARENAISAATLKDLQPLVKAIALNSKIDESRDFAASVQESMVDGLRPQHPVEDRGVHTAPFYVLIGANMPAILAEIAFVSNPEEEKHLKRPEYRDVLAHSILRGVRSYLEALSRTQTRQLTDTARRSTVAQGQRAR
jgi:N-acetylmuramoyl-L-alanine amidase